MLPAVTWYAHDIRSYPLVVCLAAGSTWTLVRALEQSSRLQWLTYASLLGLSGLLNLVSLSIVCGHAVVVVLHGWRGRGRDRGSLWGFVPAVAFGVMCTLPVLVLGRRQAGQQVDWVARPTPGSILGLWLQLFTSTPVGLAMLMLILLALVHRSSRWDVLDFAVIGLLPIGVVLVASLEEPLSYWLARYVVFTVPALAVIAGAAIGSVRPRGLGLVAMAALIVLGLPAQHFIRTARSHNWFTYPAMPPYHLSNRTVDFPGAAKIIEDGYRPGDAVVYLRGRLAYRSVDLGVSYYLPGSIKLRDVLVTRTATQLDNLWAEECANPGACAAGQHARRIWVVTLGVLPDNPFPSLPGQDVRALERTYTRVETHSLKDMTVTLMSGNGLSPVAPRTSRTEVDRSDRLVHRQLQLRRVPSPVMPGHRSSRAASIRSVL